MALVRRHRALLIGALYGLVSLTVLWFALAARSEVEYVPALPAFSAELPGTRSYYTRGFTEWIMVQERSAAPMRPGAVQMERRLRLDPEGVGEALIVLMGLSLVGYVVCPRAVTAMRLRDRCDECGYDIRSTFSDACPECGAPLPPGEGGRAAAG